MTRRWLAIGIVVTAIPAGVAVGRAASRVVAEVGQHHLTLEDLNAELQETRASGSAAALARSMTPEGRAAALDRLIAKQLMAEAATRDGLSADPDVKSRIDRAVSRILAAAYEERIQHGTDVSDRALQAYYDAHKQEFQAAPRVRARHILLKTPELAVAARAELLNGAEFAAIARERSIDRYSRETGGDLGWISAGTMVKTFEDALFALKPGEISNVVESSYGFHIIRVDEVQPAGVRAFSLVREEIRERLLQAAVGASTAELKKQFPVKVYPEALNTLER